MAKRESAKQIEVEAARWVARVESGDLSAESAAELSAWLSSDSRHTGAYARARAIGHYSDRAAALGKQFNPRTFEREGDKVWTAPTRRQILWSACAVASGIGLTAVAYQGLALLGRTYSSGLGQMRVISLADGSVVNLNTSTRVRVHFSRHKREVWLESGEALFDVAKDAARPFIVRVAGITVQALGTSFVVQNLSDRPLQILVREGTVEVDDGRAGRSTKLSANMRASAPRAQRATDAMPITVAPVAPRELDRSTAWLDGRIAFEGETLREAAKAFSRYSDVDIVIDDPAIADERVTGLYQTVNPVGFARSMAVIFDLKTDISEKHIHLYR